MAWVVFALHPEQQEELASGEPVQSCPSCSNTDNLEEYVSGHVGEPGATAVFWNLAWSQRKFTWCKGVRRVPWSAYVVGVAWYLRVAWVPSRGVVPSRACLPSRGVGAMAWVPSRGAGAFQWRGCLLDWWTYQRRCVNVGTKMNSAEEAVSLRLDFFEVCDSAL